MAPLFGGYFPLAPFSLQENVIRVFKVTLPCPAQPVIVERVIHEAGVNDVNQPPAGFRLQLVKHVAPGPQEFFREEIESVQGIQIVRVLLKPAI